MPTSLARSSSNFLRRQPGIYESRSPINIYRRSLVRPVPLPTDYWCRVDIIEALTRCSFVSVHRETPSQCLSRSLLRLKKKKLVFISQDEKLHRCRTRIIHRESESERLWSYFSAFLRWCWFVLFKVIPTTLTFLGSLLRWMVNGEENENLSYSAGCSTIWLWLRLEIAVLSGATNENAWWIRFFHVASIISTSGM